MWTLPEAPITNDRKNLSAVADKLLLKNGFYPDGSLRIKSHKIRKDRHEQMTFESNMLPTSSIPKKVLHGIAG